MEEHDSAASSPAGPVELPPSRPKKRVKGGKETAQRIGLEGLTEVKQWLEATTRFAFTYTSWDSEVLCTVTCLDGTNKTFDLVGNTISTKHPPRPVSVECKKYTTRGSQDKDFREFLAIAYSATAHQMAEVGDDERRFLWVTYHPFAVKGWNDLLKKKTMRASLAEFDHLVGGDSKPDEDIVDLVTGRTMVLVVGQKQVDLRLDKYELDVASTALRKEGLMP